MKILLTNLCLLGAALMLTTPSTSIAQRRGGMNQGSSQQMVAKRIQRYMNNGDRINVSRAFQGLVPHNQKIVSLRVIAQSTSRDSKIILKASGQRIGAVSIGMYSNSMMLRIPAHINVANVNLVVSGSAFVQRIVAQTIRVNQGQAQGQSPGQVRLVKAQLNIQTTQAGAILPEKSLIEQQTGVNLRGKNIVALVVKAKALINRNGRANSKVQVLVNGHAVGAPVRLNSVMQN